MRDEKKGKLSFVITSRKGVKEKASQRAWKEAAKKKRVLWYSKYHHIARKKGWKTKKKIKECGKVPLRRFSSSSHLFSFFLLFEVEQETKELRGKNLFKVTTFERLFSTRSVLNKCKEMRWKKETKLTIDFRLFLFRSVAIEWKALLCAFQHKTLYYLGTKKERIDEEKKKQVQLDVLFRIFCVGWIRMKINWKKNE